MKAADLWLRLRALLLRRRVERELREELDFHIERETHENIANGMDPESAARQARSRFGPTERIADDCREVQGLRLLEETRWDLAHALRTHVRNPWLTATAVITLAVGVGVNATTFSLVDYLMFRAPAHVESSARLVHLDSIENYPELLALRRGSRLLRPIGVRDMTLSLGRGLETGEVPAEFVTHDYFDVLGARPARGRWFTPEEENPAVLSSVVVISYGLWRGWFHADPEIVGRTLWLANAAYTVVGVAPRAFTGAYVAPIDVWLPFSNNDLIGGTEGLTGRRPRDIHVMARLAPGATLEQARAEGAAVLAEASGGPPSIEQVRMPDFEVSGFTEVRFRRSTDRESTLAVWLAAAAGIVLLLACANVAGLLFVRAFDRRHELAVRARLGASRARLLRQLLVETLLTALLCGAGAAMMLIWATPLVLGYFVESVAAHDVIDTRVILVTASLALSTCLLAGLLPALQATGSALRAAVSGCIAPARSQARSRSALLVVQVALTVVLLIGAGLFIRSLERVRALEFGFDPDDAYLIQVNMTGYGREQINATYARLLARASEHPAVQSAAVDVSTPFGGGIAGVVMPPADETGERPSLPFVHLVSPGYFETLGTRIVEGRGLTPQDHAGTQPVLLVTRRTAEAYWPGRSALGQCLERMGESSACWQVVGVVEDTRWSITSDRGPTEVFAPWSEGLVGAALRALYVRLAGPGALDRLLDDLRASEPDLPHLTAESLWSAMDNRTRSWRLGAAVFSAFGVLALVLASIGIFALLAFAVRQRVPEIGVRMALGARRADVVRLVVGQGMSLVALGWLLGVVASLALTRYVESLLFGVSATDSTTFVAASLVIAAVAMLAVFLPVRRATAVDPVDALRAE